jgi:hypothetical protein
LDYSGIAARSIYMMGRTGLLLDPGVDACGSVYTPIWKKNNYKSGANTITYIFIANILTTIHFNHATN